jgi:hypothetical protein
VNLVHGAFYAYQTPEKLIGALLDNLSVERIQVDMIRFTGPDFHYIDNRLMALQLVRQGLTEAAMFTAQGESAQWAEVLYNKPVLVQRGSFRPVCHVHLDMLASAGARFRADLDSPDEEILPIMELTMRNLRDDVGEVNRADFLARADMLAASGNQCCSPIFGGRWPPISRAIEPVRSGLPSACPSSPKSSTRPFTTRRRRPLGRPGTTFQNRPTLRLSEPQPGDRHRHHRWRFPVARTCAISMRTCWRTDSSGIANCSPEAAAHPRATCCKNQAGDPPGNLCALRRRPDQARTFVRIPAGQESPAAPASR